MPEEVLVPLPCPPTRVPTTTHVNGSVLFASVRGLRACGLFDRYYAALDARHRDTITGITAGQWYPIEVGVEHYAACHSLALSDADIQRIGEQTGSLLTSSMFSVLSRLTREMGASPWGPLGHVERLRERLYRGGASTLVKLGPKEARVEWYGQPCARWGYFRQAVGYLAAGILRPFATKMQVRVLTAQCDATTLAYRFSWV